MNDDLSRGLEYYRRIFGLAPLTTSAKTVPTSPPVTQTAAPEGGSVGGASTLIDLGSAGQHGESTETPASSVLENELKALGRSVRIWYGPPVKIVQAQTNGQYS